MPSLAKLHVARPADQAVPTSSERFTRALVALTRTVWDPGCTFETALGAICETAASALEVDRVSVWHYDREAGLLRCLNAYGASEGAHLRAEELETLSLDGDDYMAALQDVRTFEAIEVEVNADRPRSHSALRDYLHRHRIHALLDAPACVQGELQGVICHESIDRGRAWTQEEITFAASMGDYVAMAYEIARRRRAESEVEHLRLHDSTTGLPNRDYMVELLAQRMATPRTAGEILAVVHVRIDASGGLALSADAPTVDEMMGCIAQRLRRFTGSDVALARVRSDGFAFLLAHSAGHDTAVRFAERCLSAVRAVEWQHEEIDPGAAVGIAFADPVAYTDARVLMRQAEEAAEHARSGDKYAYEVFDLDHHDALVERLRFERGLRDAFAKGDFRVHYQPEFDIGQRRWAAAEALVRWQHGDRLKTAAEFIDVAESSGLIVPLGSWVLHRACQDAAQWPPLADGSYPTLRVNVSPRQFDEGSVVDDVTAALAAAGLAPGRLCLEITETALMGDFQHAWEGLRQLRDAGVQVAIDDFGTGYASLVYLKRFPVDVLKIDRSFVAGIPTEAVDTAIVAAVVRLAASLDIDVIAEGVERLEQQDALEAMGVKRMQGWLYARAMDHASMCRLLGTPYG